MPVICKLYHPRISPARKGKIPVYGCTAIKGINTHYWSLFIADFFISSVDFPLYRQPDLFHGQCPQKFYCIPALIW